MASSFVKKSPRRQQTLPKGTWPSVQNGQLLTSTGVRSLDEIIGGGLPIGTVLLIEEDEHTRYSQVILKYFMAQGVACGHELFLATADPSSQEIFKTLPGIVVAETNKTDAKPTSQSTSSNSSDRMKIAWRYQNIPTSGSNKSTGIGGNDTGACHFDLATTMPSDVIDQAQLTGIDLPLPSTQDDVIEGEVMLPNHRALLRRMQQAVAKAYCVGKTGVANQGILRIGFLSFGSMLWCGTTKEELTSLTAFMHGVRGLARTSYASVLITMPSYLHQSSLVRRIGHSADCVISLESFAGTPYEQSASYKEYHGLVHIIKPFQINTLVPSLNDTSSLAFKLRRRNLVIERLHLPPDLGETVSRSSSDRPNVSTSTVAKGAGSLCGQMIRDTSLDF